MWERYLNGLMAIIISGVLWGAIAFQFIKHEEPCSLCMLQRLGMLGVASGALMNVKFGPRKMHYGLSLLAAIFGGFVALRQICLHICPGYAIFGTPFWGLSLYTWSLLVFASSVGCIALLLLLFDQKGVELDSIPRLNWWGQLAFVLIIFAALINIFTTVWQCRLGPC